MDQYLKNPTSADLLTSLMNGVVPPSQSSSNGKNGEIIGSPMASDFASKASFGKQRELIGKSLNTLERKIKGSYYFAPQGAFKVGKYVAGVSGEIVYSPDGIVGKNSAGITTFALSGDTGDLVLLGTIYATAGSIGGFTIEGSYLFAGSGSSVAGLSPADYPFWAGASYSSRGSAPFRVTPDGALIATDVDLTGKITAIEGEIAGWDITATTLSKNGVTLDSGGLILVGDVDDNISMLVSGIPVLSFMIGGDIKGLMKATTARSGGVAIVGGDMALDNDYAFIAKGTGSNYARFGVTSGNSTWLVSADNDINFLTNGETTMMTVSDGQVFIPTKIQLKEISEPSNPGTPDTGFLFMKDSGGKTQLCVRFHTGATQVIATEP